MPASATEPSLHRKLVWLTFFRVVTITVLLGGTAVVSWQAGGEADAALAPLYAIVIAVYAATLLLAAALRRGAGLVGVAYAEIALDVGIAAGVAWATGRAESVFVFMFTLPVVNGAVLLFRRGAVAAAVLSTGVYLGLALAPGAPRPPAATMFVHACAFLLTAGLAAYLAEQLRTTHDRLAARENDLAEITALHESIVQSLTSGLLTLDPSGRITFMNRAGEQITGVPLRQVRGRPAAEVVAFQAGDGRDEIEHVNARGERLRLGYSAFPLHRSSGAPLGSAVIFQDLTRLRAMEEAVRRTARLADLGRVAAGLAHELRNPLASMSGSVELLRAQAADGDERRLLDIVLREAARLEQLVTDFLGFARPAPLRRVPTDVAALLDETLRVFAHDPAAARLSLERRLEPAPVECDPDQIRQVAWNLLRNAAQAIAAAPDRAEGGRIVVSCGPEARAGACFAVADDGPGVPAAERDRIFLPFHTTKERGTGLGLATVHRIVDEHGGRIELESEPGHGARFVVHLGGATRPAAPR